MKRSIISIMLAVIMVLSMFTVTAFAAEATITSTEPVIHTDTKTIDITLDSELLWISEHSANAKRTDVSTSFSGWTINIKNDIVWSGTWTPITNFHGRMVGATNEAGTAYVTISGLNVEGVADNAALCGAVQYNEGNGAPYFENICISASTFTATGWYAGAFVGNGYTAAFKNCYVTNCTISAERFAGGVAGTTYGNITNSHVSNTNVSVAEDKSALVTSGDNAGGIVGLVGEGNTAISGCTVTNCNLRGSRQIGGIAGCAQYGNTIDNCTVTDTTIYGTVSSSTSPGGRSTALGGIVGELSDGGSADITLTNNTVGGSKMSISKKKGLFGSSNTRYIGWLVGDVTRITTEGQAVISGNKKLDNWTTTLPEIGK